MSYLDLANLHVLQVMAKVDLKLDPNLTGLPGGPPAQKLLNGLAGFALLACVAVVIIGAAQWGAGTRHSNSAHADAGKSRMLIGAIGAFAVGAAAALVEFFFKSGSTV